MNDTGNARGLAAAATDRGNLYGFLAAVLRRPLSAPMLRKIRSESFAEALAVAGVDLGAGFLEAPTAQLLEELAVDFTQLFHGPGEHVAPYESVQTARDGGQLNGAAAKSVGDCIAAAGLEVDPRAGEFPDHISVELEFMSVMARKEAGAWKQGDLAAARDAVARQNQFVSTHLRAWVPAFCDMVRHRASTRLYREIADLLAGLVELDRADFDQSMPGDLRHVKPGRKCSQNTAQFCP